MFHTEKKKNLKLQLAKVQAFPFIPFLTKSNCWINKDSLFFLYMASGVLMLSRTWMVKCSILCPFLLKCLPVACFMFLFLMYPKCWLPLCARVCFVSPTYCCAHLVQVTRYTRLWVWQLYSLVSGTVLLILVALASFVCLTNGRCYIWPCYICAFQEWIFFSLM